MWIGSMFKIGSLFIRNTSEDDLSLSNTPPKEVEIVETLWSKQVMRFHCIKYQLEYVKSWV